ncbi:MAG: hypothetical protein H6849_03975 [Alphaproteobacteria bacterium]|nr:MAG: hypothetical protein H6849_03975 [Alphaproteobacteria bacterium]
MKNKINFICCSGFLISLTCASNLHNLENNGSSRAIIEDTPVVSRTSPPDLFAPSGLVFSVFQSSPQVSLPRHRFPASAVRGPAGVGNPEAPVMPVMPDYPTEGVGNPEAPVMPDYPTDFIPCSSGFPASSDTGLASATGSIMGSSFRRADVSDSMRENSSRGSSDLLQVSRGDMVDLQKEVTRLREQVAYLKQKGASATGLASASATGLASATGSRMGSGFRRVDVSDSMRENSSRGSSDLPQVSRGDVVELQKAVTRLRGQVAYLKQKGGSIVRTINHLIKVIPSDSPQSRAQASFSEKRALQRLPAMADLMKEVCDLREWRTSRASTPTASQGLAGINSSEVGAVYRLPAITDLKEEVAFLNGGSVLGFSSKRKRGHPGELSGASARADQRSTRQSASQVLASVMQVSAPREGSSEAMPQSSAKD